MKEQYIAAKERWAQKLAGKALPAARSQTRLPPGQRQVQNFPVLDLGIQPEVALDQWALKIHGKVEHPVTLNWQQFMALPQFADVSDFHCVTTWSQFDMAFAGVAFFTLTELVKRDTGEFVLEEERDSENFRWVALENRRVTTAYMNPPLLDDADHQHERVLETAPYHLDLGSLNLESIDLFYTFDFVYPGNHDQLMAEALGQNSPFDGLVGLDGARVLSYEPSILIALDDKCKLQARVGVESRSTIAHVQSGQFPETSLSVYCLIRQMWGKQPFKTFAESYSNQRRVSQELLESFVIPNVVTPLAHRIAIR